MNARTIWLTAAASLLAVATAHADDPDPQRSIAVLEYRAGSPELPAIDEQCSQILERSTSLDVMDTEEARKEFGNHLDREVVKCSGTPTCIARIGKKLGVKEVLLVGVSEFGDVILTLQRIDVGSRAVLMRIAEALAPGEAPPEDVLTGYLRRVMPESDFLRFGVIQIEANVKGAKVVVGNESRGKTPIEPLTVPAPETYVIKLSKDGYTSFKATVDVPPDVTVKVEPVLTLEGQSAWYKKWWVAAIAGTVVVGAVTLGVMAAQDDPTDVPIEIPPF
jgi:hypothetical protein